MDKLTDLYTDYLLISSLQTSSTGLSRLLDNKISHDQITRFLSSKDFTSKDLWRYSKKLVRKISSEDGVILFDDTIEEKIYGKESDIICWHYDHTKGHSIKGFNIVTCV